MNITIYHQKAAPVARGRTITGDGRIPGFESGLAATARRLLLSGAALTDYERQLLKDLARSEARYPMKTLQALIAIAPRCPEAHDREALAEFIRELVLQQCSPIACPFAAFELETKAQGVADLWQWRYARSPNEATRAQVIHALRQQFSATRLSIDALVSA